MGDRATADRGTPSGSWAAEEKQRNGATSEEKFVKMERTDTWKCPWGGVSRVWGLRKVWEQEPRSTAPHIWGAARECPLGDVPQAAALCYTAERLT